jgi:hypothetical protein
VGFESTTFFTLRSRSINITVQLIVKWFPLRLKAFFPYLLFALKKLNYFRNNFWKMLWNPENLLEIHSIWFENTAYFVLISILVFEKIRFKNVRDGSDSMFISNHIKHSCYEILCCAVLVQKKFHYFLIVILPVALNQWNFVCTINFNFQSFFNLYVPYVGTFIFGFNTISLFDAAK